MAYIKVSLDYPIEDGMNLTFKAPCDCTAVTGLKVYYPEITDASSTSTSKVFTFTDSHNEPLTTVGNLFKQNAYMSVLLDTTNNRAYMLNADTNKYIELKQASPITFEVNKTPSDDDTKVHVTVFPSYTIDAYSLMLSGQKFLVSFQYDEEDLAICEAFAAGKSNKIYCQVPPNVKEYYSGNYLQLYTSGTSWLASLGT